MGAGECVDEPVQTDLEPEHLPRVCTFLRSEDGRGSVLVEQRVVDVSGDDEVDAGQVDEATDVEPAH